MLTTVFRPPPRGLGLEEGVKQFPVRARGEVVVFGPVVQFDEQGPELDYVVVKVHRYLLALIARRVEDDDPVPNSVEVKVIFFGELHELQRADVVLEALRVGARAVADRIKRRVQAVKYELFPRAASVGKGRVPAAENEEKSRKPYEQSAERFAAGFIT